MKSRNLKSLFLAFACVLALVGCSTSKVNVNYYVNQPDCSYNPDAKADTLVINFYGSAAKINEVGKTPSAPITISPEIKGKWVWASDTELVFTPQENWKLGTKYEVNIDPKVFANHIYIRSKPTFETASFYVGVQSEEFYINPLKPEEKRCIVVLGASHPVDKESVKDLASMVLVTPDSNGKTLSQEVPFTIDFSDDSREIYLTSDLIKIPPRTSTMNVVVKSGIKAIVDATYNKGFKSYITVPGMNDFVKINNISHRIVLNEQNNYEQVIIVETKGSVEVEKLMKSMSAYVLPTDCPAEQGWKEIKNCNWTNVNYNRITESVLNNSKKISLSPIPTPEVASEVNSYVFKAPTNSYVYVKIEGKVEFFGGYYYDGRFENVVKTQEFPKELKILSEGTILSLNGTKKMAICSRGIKDVNYSLARIMPKDVNHLISMSNGDMRNFSFSSYNFNENNISEKVYSSYKVPNATEDKISYFNYDFGPQLVERADKNLKNGLFLFEVSENSSNYNKRTDRRLILVTDLGFVVKKNRDGSQDVFVQSISSGNPVSGAKVQVIGLNGNPVLEATTDYEGHCVLPAVNGDKFKNEHRPVAYVVKTYNDLSFMPFSQRGRTLDYSNYDVGGEYGNDDPSKINAFLFTDRGMYKPGEKVNLGIISKSGDWKVNLENVPMEIVVTDPQQNVIYTKQFKVSRSGFDEVSFSTQDYSDTGRYTATLNLLKEYKEGTERVFLNSETFKVEEFLPDNLKIDISLDPKGNEGWINPCELKSNVKLRTLYGTAAVGNEVKSSMTLNAGFPSIRKYNDYNFTDPFYKGNTYSEYLGDQVTDEEGNVTYNIDLNKFEKASYRLEVFAEGYEKGSGRNVSDSTSIYVSPLKYLIGCKADGKLSYINKNTVRKLSFVAIDQNLNKIDLPNVTLKVEEIKYISTLVKQPNGVYKYQSVKKNYEIANTKINISKYGTEYTVATANAGEYKITLIDENGLVFNTINYTVVGAENVTRSLTRTAELEISLESSDLKAGDTAKVFIKAPYAGAGLITVERDKVYSYKWFKTSELSSVQTIKIPESLEGNAYINVMFSRDANSKEIFMSPFCYGAIPFTIDKGFRNNKITLDVPEVVKSGETLNINYSSETPGKIIVYAVDEGILQVANYKTPNPLAYFFKKRAMEVKTSQILDLVLPEYDVLKTVTATGGGASMRMLAKNLNPFKRKTNAPVAYWSGIMDCDASVRSVKYKVPDYYNGNIKVFAISVNPDKIGVAENSSFARATFIITPNIPLAVAPGDEFDASITVYNNHKNVGDGDKVTLRAIPSDNLEIIGDKTFNLTIDEGKDATVFIRVKAKDKLGGGEITFVANDATEQSKLSATTSVRPAVPYRVWVNGGKANGNSASTALEHVVYDEFGKREVAVANIPTAFFDGLKMYLETYPYGCSEQITSQSFPYLYDEVVKASGKTKAEAKEFVNNTIGILQSRQKYDGSIGYWTTGSEYNPFITVYCAEFITTAKSKGYQIPHDFEEKLMNAVSSIAGMSKNDGYSIYLRSYAIYVLTKNEKVTTSYIEKLEADITKKNFDKFDYEGLYLAASYKMLGQDKKASELIGKIVAKKTFDSSWTYHNGLHYTSTYIDIIATYFPDMIKAVKGQMLDSLCEYMGYRYYSTYSVQQALRGLIAYTSVDRSEIFDVKQKVGEETKTISVSGSAVYKGTYDKNASEITYKIEKNLPMYYQTVTAGYETTVPNATVNKGLEVYREFCDLEGKPKTTFEVGDDVMVKVSVRSLNGTQSNIAIVDIQCAGLEADTESVRNFKSNAFKPDYVDVREDRVVIYATVKSSVSTFTYKAKVINSGSFVVPPMFAQSMYDTEVYAYSTSSKIEVSKK